MKLLIASLLGLVCATARGQVQSGSPLSAPVHTANYSAIYQPGKLIPYWSGGYMVQPYLAGDGFDIYSSQGAFVASIKPHFPVGEQVTTVKIEDVSINSDKIVWIGYIADDSGMMSNVIVSSDFSGQVQQVLLTGDFGGIKVCLDTDQTIWAVGGSSQKDSVGDHSYGILRHYDFNLGQLSELLSRSQLDGTNSTFPLQINSPHGGPWLVCSKKRIGLFLGETGNWYQWSKKSAKLSSWAIIPPSISGATSVSFTGYAYIEGGSGHVYASMDASQGGRRMSFMAELKPLQNIKNTQLSWNPLETIYTAADGTTHLQSQGEDALFGSDGNFLIYRSTKEFGRVEWARPAKLSTITFVAPSQ